MNKILYLLRSEVACDENQIEEYSGEIYDDAIIGFKRLKEENPKVVVIDLGLDKITGLELINIIRENPKYHHIKLIAVSKFYNPYLGNLAYEAGCDYYITYPISHEFIRNVLEMSEFEENMFKYKWLFLIVMI